MGVNPSVPQMAALLLSVVVVAVGSSLRVFELGSITPKFFFFDFTLLTLTMLIIGGRNSVAGALTGVVIITAGNEFTRYLAGPDVDVFGLLFRPGLSRMFLGAAMLGFMIFRPRGLLDDWELDSWFFSRWRRAREVEPAMPEPAVDGPAAAISAIDVTVDFGGFRALDDAHIDTSRESVTGIIGPNGAGKTTLLNVLTGMVPAATGSFALDGEDLTGEPPYEIARKGLVRTFQNLRLFPRLTVRENVAIAALAGRRPDDAIDFEPILFRVGLWEHRDRRASELDYGNARRLELARAAAASPVFILLDEPTSGMSDAESIAMIDRVRDTAALVGAGVIVIDHDLGFITGICDRIYCLDQGTVISVGYPVRDPGRPPGPGRLPRFGGPDLTSVPVRHRRGGPMELTYGDYLKVPELLELQQLRSEAEHDEMLFIVVHQVYELWFKQILHELDQLGHHIDNDALALGEHQLVRILKILKTLVQQIDVLETMTPLEFMSFRSFLGSASGFQSAQFREMEFVLGAKNAAVLDRFRGTAGGGAA